MDEQQEVIDLRAAVMEARKHVASLPSWCLRGFDEVGQIVFRPEKTVVPGRDQAQDAPRVETDPRANS